MTAQSAFIIYDIFNQREDIVSVEATIGHAQIGSSHLKLDNTVLGDEDNSFTKDIGQSKDLVRKTLNIFTTIQDVQDATDKVSLVVKITGGKKTHEQTVLDSTVATPSSIATVVTSVVFI